MRQEPKRVEKGWGHELWIHNCPLYCGKLLFLAAGKRCSWHYHELKTETFYLRSGSARVTYGKEKDRSDAEEVLLVPGDVFHVEPLTMHQITALEDTEIYEFSTQHFDEDSHRVEKGD